MVNSTTRTWVPGADKAQLWLTALDRRLSRPFFLLKLPISVLEFGLSIPGNWFGIPLVTLLLMPSWTTIFLSSSSLMCMPISGVQLPRETEQEFSQKNVFWWHGTVLFLSIGVFVVWIGVYLGNRRAIKFFYSPVVLGILAPLGGVLLLRWRENFIEGTESPNSNDKILVAIQTGYFQASLWSLSIIPVIILKTLVLRHRPAYWCQEGHSDDNDDEVRQAYQRKGVLPKLFRSDGRHSFPSGDTTGAMATMYPLLKCCCCKYNNSNNSNVDMKFFLVCVALVVLSSVGRMYWLAHHLFDTIVGVGIALLVGYFFEHVLSSQWWVKHCDLGIVDSDSSAIYSCQCTRWQAFVVQTILVGFVMVRTIKTMRIKLD